MQSERYTSMDSIYGGEGIRFNARIGGRNIGVNVDQTTILRLAEMTKITGHIGHALWHIENPDTTMPCSTCEKKIQGIQMDTLDKLETP